MEFKNYLKNIKNKIEHSTEYTLRTDFENLLNNIKPKKTIKIIQESKKTEKQTFGKPDFYVTQNDLEIGWIETKPYKDSLDKYIETEQLKRYLSVIPNLLFTNYRDFILFRDGEQVLNSTLIMKGEKNLQKANVEKTKQLIDEFFDARFQLIKKPEKLSKILAKHAKFLRKEFTIIINNNIDNWFRKKLLGLYELFKTTLIENLTKDEYIDAYTQTVVYGLFLAGLNADTKQINKYNFTKFIPKSLNIFHEVFNILQLSNIPESVEWIIDKMLMVLNNINYKELQDELSFIKPSSTDLDKEDPYIYFYENLIKEYDKTIKFDKGVFYTPVSVVKFIVSSVGDILRNDFNKIGYSDENITMLDFATGTGTFLLETYKESLKEVDKSLQSKFIKERLLKNFFGFEYLIAPYAVAHIKLIQFLKENNYKFLQNDRIPIYLTDTLDDTSYKEVGLFPYLSEEGKIANRIKMEDKIQIIIGNPPYSNYSKNKKLYIKSLIADYKKGLENEKNIRNLNDDYIKFIRFAQAKIEGQKYNYKQNKNLFSGEIKGAGKGIVGIITNNSYLNGITHRRMRESLLNTFDKIYIINLHGNSNRQEGDKNVFDIKVGVSIVIFVKLEKSLKRKKVYYFSTLENKLISREEKFNFLNNNNIDTIEWTELNPKLPNFWFIYKDLKNEKNYKKAIKITEIFEKYGSASETGYDSLLIDFNKTNLIERIKYTLKNKEKEIIDKYNIKKKMSNWNLKKHQKAEYNDDKIIPIQYRVFDKRWIFYDNKVLARSRFVIMKHIINKKNIALIFKRQMQNKNFKNAFATETIIERSFLESGFGGAYIAPLYVYENDKKTPNFTNSFSLFIKKQYEKKPEPEQIFSYLYSILYSKTYRRKYNEFLKSDFPKIFFTKNEEIFYKLSELGKELIQNHLLKINYKPNILPKLHGEGNFKLENINFIEKENKLYINKKQYFDKITDKIWNYQIGNYKILQKYLNYRKKKELNFYELNHIKKVILSISKTMELQNKIDKLCFDWI